MSLGHSPTHRQGRPGGRLAARGRGAPARLRVLLAVCVAVRGAQYIEAADQATGNALILAAASSGACLAIIIVTAVVLASAAQLQGAQDEWAGQWARCRDAGPSAGAVGSELNALCLACKRYASACLLPARSG